MKYNSPLISLVIVILLVAVAYYYIVPSPHRASPLRISVEEARDRRFGLIVDLRTPSQRDRLGYYPNSIPISLDRLGIEVPMDISNKNTWILVYGEGGNDVRPHLAAETLYKMGYPHVRFITESYLSLMPGSQ